MMAKIENNKLKAVKVTKISDDKFNGNHPNEVYVGNSYTGFTKELPKKGVRFNIGTLLTSTITQELDKDNIFKTLYSTYKLEFL